MCGGGLDVVAGGDGDVGAAERGLGAEQRAVAEHQALAADDVEVARRVEMLGIQRRGDESALHAEDRPGQLEDAGRTLETAIGAQKKRTPELAVLQQRMGKVSAALGDRDGQLNWLKKAFDVDRKNAEVAAELAQLATEIGDYELALKPLRAITLMDNPAPVTRPMALLWEAKIEHARGNRAKAELWAKKALREDPQFADAQQFLDELGG